MKHAFFILVSVFILVVAIMVSISAVHKADTLVKEKMAQQRKSTMQITSSAFLNNQSIPEIYSCKGQGINPPLSFSHIPDATKSLVLIMEDPDAPMGTFIHWVVYNISPAITRVDENSTISEATYGQNGVGKAEYTAPCPPSGTHHYHFTLSALDILIDDTNPLTKIEVEKKMQGHIIDQATLTGLVSN